MTCGWTRLRGLSPRFLPRGTMRYASSRRPEAVSGFIREDVEDEDVEEDDGTRSRLKMILNSKKTCLFLVKP